MENISLDKPIIFNKQTFKSILIYESAQKHFGIKTQEILKYIASTLDGQNRTPDEPNNPLGPVFKVVSHCTESGVPKVNDFRDTYFRLLTENKEIVFFHSSPLREEQYENRPEKMKKRIENNE